MNRVEKLNELIDRNINYIDQRNEPSLTDTKTITEILKAILVLEQIKKLEGQRSAFDELSDSDLEAKLNEIGE